MQQSGASVDWQTQAAQRSMAQPAPACSLQQLPLGAVGVAVAAVVGGGVGVLVAVVV
jgi:hypothetical protein